MKRKRRRVIQFWILSPGHPQEAWNAGLYGVYGLDCDSAARNGIPELKERTQVLNPSKIAILPGKLFKAEHFYSTARQWRCLSEAILIKPSAVETEEKGGSDLTSGIRFRLEINECSGWPCLFKGRAAFSWSPLCLNSSKERRLKLIAG